MRVRLLVAYDGGPYRGFARNSGVRTVAGGLEAALSTVLGEQIVVTAAGRTDAGVHAWGQVVSFDTTSDRFERDGPVRLRSRLNAICGPSIVVREVEVAEPSFDARRSARWRRYRYTVLRRDVADPFLAPFSWWVPAPLDLDSMRQAAVPLVGSHDFSSFCRRPKVSAGAPEPSLVRRVLDAGWDDLGGGLLRFEIRASSFCHQMVRSMVGLQVDVGRGRRRAADVARVLGARDRAAVGNLAPPHGLCLWEVGY